MGFFDRGSFVAAAGYDIRVTERCAREDIDLDLTILQAGAGVPIIRGLIGKHDQSSEFVDTVGPTAGAKTLGTLQFGNDHRGAVWLDRPNNAFWLCAYHFHRSGEVDDAFPYFDQLIAQGRMYPTDPDRERLFVDRAERFVDAIPAAAIELKRQAFERTGTEVRGAVGPLPIRLVVVEADGLHELQVAISLVSGEFDLMQATLQALYPADDTWRAWRPITALATGPIDGARVEVAYACLMD